MRSLGPPDTGHRAFASLRHIVSDTRTSISIVPVGLDNAIGGLREPDDASLLRGEGLRLDGSRASRSLAVDR